MGLRDALTLADLITNESATELGSAPMLAAYSKLRSRDVKGGVLFTDLLVNVFGNEIIGLQAARGLGLGALELMMPIKNRLVCKMSFGK